MFIRQLRAMQCFLYLGKSPGLTQALVVLGEQDPSDVSQLSLIQENILAFVKYILLIC